MSRVRGSVTNNNGFWNAWLDLLALLLQLQSIITAQINDCLRLAPFPPGLRTYSLPLWLLVLIYESVTSSVPVVRWLTLHSWIHHDCNLTTNERLQYDCLLNHYLASFYNSGRTEDRTLPQTIRLLLHLLVVTGTCVNSVATKALCRIRA
jgi:hypothetical protein